MKNLSNRCLGEFKLLNKKEQFINFNPESESQSTCERELTQKYNSYKDRLDQCKQLGINENYLLQKHQDQYLQYRAYNRNKNIFDPMNFNNAEANGLLSSAIAIKKIQDKQNRLQIYHEQKSAQDHTGTPCAENPKWTKARAKLEADGRTVENTVYQAKYGDTVGDAVRALKDNGQIDNFSWNMDVKYEPDTGITVDQLNKACGSNVKQSDLQDGKTKLSYANFIEKGWHVWVTDGMIHVGKNAPALVPAATAAESQQPAPSEDEQVLVEPTQAENAPTSGYSGSISLQSDAPTERSF